MLLTELVKTKSLSEIQHDVFAYMVDHHEEIADLTLAQLAAATYTSSATLVRLAKKFDFGGFIEFRDALVDELDYLDRQVKGIDANRPIAPDDSLMSVASKISILEKEALDETLSLLDHDTLRKAVNILRDAKTIHLCGVSFNHALGNLFAGKMMRLGKPVILCPYEEDYLYTAALIEKQDAAVMISYSGSLPIIRRMMRMYQNAQIPIIALTSYGPSDLRTTADVTLTIVTREKMYSKIAGFSNETSIKLLLDILYACYFSLDYQHNDLKKQALGHQIESYKSVENVIIRESK